MNRSSVRHRKSSGKESPLSKRPKLDFTVKVKESVQNDKNQSFHDCNGVVKDNTLDLKSLEKKNNENGPTVSDWDDDFSGDMLEKVCLIADLSQAMVSNQPTLPKSEKIKGSKETTPKSKPLNQKSENLDSNIITEEENEEFQKLKLEYNILLDKFKTKEGEVHILRSQLKQNEEAKQAVALLNIKVMEDIQKKFNEKISITEKELETTKTKLQFKDMEFKTLSERFRQLEYSISKSKVDENQTDSTKNFFEVSGSVSHKNLDNEAGNQHSTLSKPKETTRDFNFVPQSHHEGKSLEKFICPEFFKFIEEPNVVSFYKFQNCTNTQRLELEKRQKYKWSGLPKPTVFIKDLYNLVASLFICETFSSKETEEVVDNILKICLKILTHTKEVLVFLDKLQLQNNECDDADQSLLENEMETGIVTLKNLLDNTKLNEEECGIECRRSLALMYSLSKSSSVAFDWIQNNINFFILLKDIVALIGNLRRPLRYTGVLVGITFILQNMLEDKNLRKEITPLFNEIIEEIIFARPKLDVLYEVVNTLAAGKHHIEFLKGICRKSSVESCALYMDSKLKQAMFFTKNACPLKILCMQIMGLACAPSSESMRWDITNCVIKWLNNSINNSSAKNIKWLPTFFRKCEQVDNEACFNVTECLLHLLNLCLKDYNMNFSFQENESVVCTPTKNNFTRNHLISIIGHGAVLLKRILKVDQRLLHVNIYSLRFATLLKAFLPNLSNPSDTNEIICLSSVQKESISWIVDLLDNDIRIQDSCLKNSCSLPDVDIFHRLKIKESKIY